MNAGTVFDTSNTWQTTSSSVLEINADTIVPGIADTATIRAPLYNALNGSQINVNSGKLIIDGAFVASSAAAINVANFADVQFNGTATIHGDLDLGTSSDLIVNGNLTVNDSDFDWDGVGIANHTTINSGAKLTVNTNQLGIDNDFDATIDINGGELETSIIGGIFNVGATGNINMDTTSGNALIRGSFLALHGDIDVNGSNTAMIVNGARFATGSTSNVEAGAALRIIDLARFSGGTTHTGDGSLQFAADITVEGATTIDMPGGTVALDTSGSNNTISVDNDLTINAATMGGIGSAGFGTQTINVDNTDSTLAVNLTDSSSEWTLFQDGIINVTGGGTLQTSLAGSDLNIKGRLNVNDDTRITARLDIEATGIVDVNTNILHLNGGTSADPNTIAGGFVDGNNGQLVSSGSKSLTGFGTINPDINFSSGSDLRADGGTLVLNGNIISADILSVGSGANLQLNNALNTSGITALQLDGGSVLGQAINNTGTIRGHGTLKSMGLSNLGSISAEGGELIIDTTNAPDLDSFGSTAVLNAVTGNLTVRSALTDDYSGAATIAQGRFIDFQAGWTQGLAGQLSLNGGGTVRATLKGGPAILRGTTTISGQAEFSAITTFDAAGEFEMPNTTDHLNLRANSTVQAGATFTGDGALINDGFVMNLAHGADVGVHVANRGLLRPAGSAIGQVTVKTLELFPVGQTEFHIGGTTPSGSDSITVLSDAFVDGDLLVSLTGGFMPSLGDNFSLIDTTAGFVIGTFSSQSLPTLSGGLRWLVDYSNSREVSLEVTNMLTGDFDGNGDFACDDIDALVGVIAAGSNDLNFDLTGDGSVTSADLTAWLAEAGAAELVSGNPYLPGDATLDGNVNGADFLAWNGNKFSPGHGWCGGDFNADGTTDGSDFLLWNANKFTSADRVATVPEPNAFWLVALVGLGVFVNRQR